MIGWWGSYLIIGRRFSKYFRSNRRSWRTCVNNSTFDALFFLRKITKILNIYNLVTDDSSFEAPLEATSCTSTTSQKHEQINQNVTLRFYSKKRQGIRATSRLLLHGVSNRHQPDCLSNSMSSPTAKKISKLSISDPVWGGYDRWISLTRDQ